MKSRANNGFTLIELLIAIIVLAIILTLGVPSFVDTLDKRRITNATKTLVSQVQQARSLAVLLNQPVTMEFRYTDGGSWCFGVTDFNTCDCTVANSCSVARPPVPGAAKDPTDRIYVQSSSAEFPNVSLTGVANQAKLIFEPTRGVRTDALGPDVTWSFASTTRARGTNVRVNAIGRASACTSSGGPLFGGLRSC
jgi:type IV fimbrial biogenesis protein FimT